MNESAGAVRAGWRLARPIVLRSAGLLPAVVSAILAWAPQASAIPQAGRSAAEAQVPDSSDTGVASTDRGDSLPEVAESSLPGASSSTPARAGRGSWPRADEPTTILDSSRLRLEFGARSDVSNESYYEDAFVDTTFLGRRLVHTPEGRYASVVAVSLAGTRNRRATSYQLQSEVSYGNLLHRGTAALSWKSPLGTDWSLLASPSLEYRSDRTFGRDLEEWRGAFGGRLRRTLGEGLSSAEMGARIDFLRASGQGAAFLLDRNGATLSGAVDHLGLLGDEWRAGYRVSGRAFPDSSARDHVEQVGEGRKKWVFQDGTSLALDVLGTRRVAVRAVPTSRDRFWNGEVGLETRLALGARWPVVARVGAELFRYDVEDSALFFDYQIARARLIPRYERDGRWMLGVGPRFEILSARINPAEDYREIAVVVEAEFLGGGSWWNVSPAAGWRDYVDASDAGLAMSSLHTSYAFYELHLIADQPLPGRLRARALAAVRWERHLDPAQDARSLFVSGELRWSP